MKLVARVIAWAKHIRKRIELFLRTPVEQWSLTDAKRKWMDTHHGEMVIGPRTSIKGTLKADHIIVKGRVDGRVNSSLLTITQRGILRGRVFAKSFEVNEHATLDAKCQIRKESVNKNLQGG